MMKFLSNAVVTLAVIMMIWFGMSYIEILCKHYGPNSEYSDKNIIVNIVEWASEYHNLND